MQVLENNSYWLVIAAVTVLLIVAGFLILPVVLSKRNYARDFRQQIDTLRAGEQIYRSFFENSVVAMLRLSLQDWTILEANEAFRKMFAAVPLDVKSNFLECLPTVDQTRLKTELQEKDVVENFETTVQCSDGTPLWISISGRQHFNDGYIDGVVIDRTSSFKAAERLREQAKLVEDAHDAIIVLNPENCVRFWNPAAEHLFLWTTPEAMGRPITDLIYSEQERPAFWKRRDELTLTGEWSGEVSQVRKDGSLVVTSSRWTLVRGAGGKPESILEIHRDITEKKLLEAKFLRIQRLESLGILAGGIAHDLNNVLAPIILSIQSLKKKWDDVSSRNHLTTLETSAHRGADLVKQVLTFARGIEGQRVAIRLETLVNEVLKTASQTFPRSIELESAIGDDLWLGVGDTSQLVQVLMNLCINARDAMPHGGRLSITAENAVVDETFVKKNPEAKSGVYVVIQVTDTGKGIPPTELDKIFEPFYTTKSLGQGTGLGLSTALGIVKSHQGFILVDSRVGFGTTFKVYLPAQLYQSSEDISVNRTKT